MFMVKLAHFRGKEPSFRIPAYWIYQCFQIALDQSICGK